MPARKKSNTARKKASKAVSRPTSGGDDGAGLEPSPTPAPAEPAGPAPLAGVRVLEASRSFAGSMAGFLLANFGAEVIKVEQPGMGDPERHAEPRIGEMGATFALINRGKKSVALNLDDQRGQEAFLALAVSSDVVLASERPGALEEKGLDLEHLRERNRRLILAALSGFGQTGPYSQKAGHDLNFMALSGALQLIGGETGTPVIPGLQLADYAGGALPCVIGVLLALLARQTTGEGQLVDVAAYDGIAGLLAWPLASYAATRRKAQRGKELLFGEYACYNLYPVRNSRWVAVAAIEPQYWANLCQAIDRDELIDEQFAPHDRQQVVIAELTRVFQRKDISEWMERFEGLDVCVTEVRDVGAAAHDPHLIERGALYLRRDPEGGAHAGVGVFPLLRSTHGRIGGEPPRLGEHSVEILRAAGLSQARIDDLLSAGVLHGQ